MKSLPLYGFYFLVVLVCIVRAERGGGPAVTELWKKFDAAPSSDGRIRLSAVWYRYLPGSDILDEDTVRASDKKGFTYEFYVLIQNVGKEDVVVPSPVKNSRRNVAEWVNGNRVVPYMIYFGDLLGRTTLVESAAAFRPVSLKPGESTRLPIFYRITEKLEPHWFFYAVDDKVAKRYGWWDGALKCKGEEYLPNQQLPDPTSSSVTPPAGAERTPAVVADH